MSEIEDLRAEVERLADKWDKRCADLSEGESDPVELARIHERRKCSRALRRLVSSAPSGEGAVHTWRFGDEGLTFTGTEALIAPVSSGDAAAPPAAPEAAEGGTGEADPEFCAPSQRVDGKRHSWKFDGDDPYIICHYCDEMRDARTGRVVRPAPVVAPSAVEDQP